ncbi:hypothetical protein V7L32_001361 [Salmonella enterica]
MRIMGINIIDLLFLVLFSSLNLGVLLSVFVSSDDDSKKDKESKTGDRLNDK